MHAQIARRSKPSQRHGFTLLELLIAITIVALLSGLLVVAVQGARRTALLTAVKTEILDIETALESFKTEYGVYPPSGVVLFEDPTAWDATQLQEIQRIWPFFNPGALDLDGNGTPGEASDGIDFNGNGEIDEVLILDGSECLAFFLGGMMATDVVEPSSTTENGTLVAGKAAGDAITRWGPLGFSKSPTNPFTRQTASRVEPFIELDVTRLTDTRDNIVVSPSLGSPADPPTTTSAGADGMPSYLDAYPDQLTPLAYLRATPIGGYDYSTGVGVNTLAPIDSDSLSLGDIYSTPTGQPINNKKFQLVSPGLDGIFGTGGIYDAETGVDADPSRRVEADNVTNFAEGTLGQ